MAIAIIPARGGSQRIPRKNIRDFHGKPIIAYSIETALKSDIFDRVIVSTDSKEIMDIAEDYGAGVHVRSDKMSQDEVGTHEVVKNVLEEFSIENEAICCIYATAPLMSVEDLEYGLEVLINDDFNYTMSVGINTQADAGQFYWGGAEDFLIDMPLIDTGTGMIPIEPERVCDINTFVDWKRAEAMYAKLLQRKDRLILIKAAILALNGSSYLEICNRLNIKLAKLKTNLVGLIYNVDCPLISNSIDREDYYSICALRRHKDVLIPELEKMYSELHS